MKRVVRLYYGYQFFFSLLLWLPIFYEYQKRMGLSDGQIFAIQSIYYIVFCFLEIPTGMAADRWGHRQCLRWGSVVLVVSNCLPIFTPTYPGFLWHFLLIALARSLNSGASSAYLYDYLNEHEAAPH
jgi:nitrate/nitrite transporter NarK